MYFEVDVGWLLYFEVDVGCHDYWFTVAILLIYAIGDNLFHHS